MMSGALESSGGIPVVRPAGAAYDRRMPPPRAGAPARRRADRLPVMGLLSACALLRLVMTFHHRVNTDEPQHLHVAWAWTQGLLVYRDVFDNHAPLFSLLLAPLLARVGERPDVVTIMRLAMIPLVVVALWSTWLLARRLHGAAAAWWAVVLAAAWPDFAIGSVEYRADQLWVALWTGALAVGFGGSLTRGRAFAAGLLIGAAFGASMKTSLLLAAVAAAALAALALPAGTPGGAGSGARPRPGALAASAGLGLLGVTVVPAAIVAFWAARGGLESLIHGTVRHNLLG